MKVEAEDMGLRNARMAGDSVSFGRLVTPGMILWPAASALSRILSGKQNLESSSGCMKSESEF